MSSHPKCTIILTEKAKENPLTSESNCRAIETDPATPQRQVTPPIPTSVPVTVGRSPVSSPEPVQVLTSASTKWPRPCPLLPTASIISVQTIPDDDSVADETPKAKKAKPNPRQVLQTDPSIIEIEDDDQNDEPLNKAKPSVDIQAFFIELPPLAGQKKGCMMCDLCA